MMRSIGRFWLHSFSAWLALLAIANLSHAGTTYQLTSSPVTWHQAESEAVAAGGHLVTINDATEQATLMTLFGSDQEYWIGFNDEATEGAFVWSSGEPVTYTNWEPNEPNNNSDEDYAVMNWTLGPSMLPGKWNDLKNDSGFVSQGVIEIPVADSDSSIATPAIGFSSAVGGFRDNVPRVIGWEFTTGSQPLRVTQLGAYDHGQDGLQAAHSVAIYRLDKTEVVSATVPTGGTGILDGSFRYVEVASTILPANSEFVIAAS